MHTLILLRHAKAEPPAMDQADIDRPLARRGREDACAAGEWLATQHLRPDLVLSSPSLRTRETWTFVEQGMAKSGFSLDKTVTSVMFPSVLYTQGVHILIDLVTKTPESIGTLLLLGHNPTISGLSVTLDSRGGLENGLRTAGLAIHAIDHSWAECKQKKAPLVQTHTARFISR